MLTIDRVEAAPPAPNTGQLPSTVATDKRRRNVWLPLVTLLAFAQYTLVGAWMMYVRHYAIGDSLSRTLSAKLMVLSRDPHLGAVGFYWMPLPTITRIPFVLLLQPFGRVELAGPMTSALFAALTIPVIVAIGRLLDNPRMAGVVAGIYAVSPLTLYVGGNGMSESTFAFCLALTMWAYLKWRHQGTIQSLAMLGVTLGLTLSCRYEGLVLVPVVAVAVALATEALTRFQSVFIAVFPAFAVFVGWSVASSLILGDAMFWYNASRTTTGTPADASWLPAHRTIGSVAVLLAIMLGALAPAIVAVVGGCASAFKRWRTSLGVLGFILALPLVIGAQVLDGSSWGAPRFFITLPVVTAVGVLWVLRAGRHETRTYAFGVAGVVLLGVGAVTGGLFLSSHKWAHAEGEYVLMGPLFGRERAASTVDDSGPNRVFSGDIRPYMRLTNDLDRYLAKGQRAAMDSLQAVPVLLTEYPDQWIVPEDRDFEEILSDPVGRFDFIVILPSTAPTVYRVLLDNELQRDTGGSWEKVGDYDGLALVYEWVPAGESSTLIGELAEPLPPRERS